MSSKIYFTIDQTPEGKIQLSINDEDACGYRICGPKYDGRSKTIKRHEVTIGDAETIRSYFRKIARATPVTS